MSLTRGHLAGRLEPWPRPTARSRQWTVRYALLAYVAAFVGAVALAAVALLVGLPIPRADGTLVVDVAMLACLVPLIRRGSLGVRDLGLRRVPGARSVGLVVLAFLAVGVCDSLWTTTVHPGGGTSLHAGLRHETTLVIVLAGFAAAVSAPVVEEIFFRGFLYRSLRNRFSIVSACVISSIMFALPHTQYPLDARVEVAIFGIAACLLYERTGSLLPGIAMHSFVDASAFERALSGRSWIVATAYLLLAVILLARPPLRSLRRRLRGEPAFRIYQPAHEETVPAEQSPTAGRAPSLLGARMAAILIDGLVLVVPVFAIAWMFSRAFPNHGLFFTKSVSSSPSGTTTTGIALRTPGVLLVCGLSLSYFFLYEALSGQTVGKRAMGLRVRSATGGHPGLNAVSARTVLRLIDILPFFYLLGALVALLSGSRRRRIGDWAGGTVVVRDSNDLAAEPSRDLSWRVASYPAAWLFAVLLVAFFSTPPTTGVRVHQAQPSAALERGEFRQQPQPGGAHNAVGGYPGCAEAGFNAPGSREGVCVRADSTGATTLYDVVDRGHPLRMPEYEARILGFQIKPTRVSNAAENEDLYPHGHGELVSFEVMITNTGGRPIQFGAGTATAPAASYPARPLVELGVPSPGSIRNVGYPAIVKGRGAPTPSVFEPRPIAPRRHVVGWVTFVAPPWSQDTLGLMPADIEFFRLDGNADYVGQVRLWKYGTLAPGTPLARAAAY